MIESSKDILYIVISFCILWATVFLCWVFYYAGKILKNTSQIIEEFRVRLQALAESISYIQDKVEGISTMVNMALKGAGGVLAGAIKKKANAWLEEKSEDFTASAQEAVNKAVNETAKKINKVTKKISK